MMSIDTPMVDTGLLMPCQVERSLFVDGAAVAGESVEDPPPALLCQVKGRRLSFQVSTQSRMSWASAWTLRCVERWSFLVVRAENHRSTRFIHDP